MMRVQATCHVRFAMKTRHYLIRTVLWKRVLRQLALLASSEEAADDPQVPLIQDFQAKFQHPLETLSLKSVLDVVGVTETRLVDLTGNPLLPDGGGDSTMTTSTG